MPRLTPFNPPATPDDTLRIWRGPKPSEMPAIRAAKLATLKLSIAMGRYDAHDPHGAYGCTPLAAAAEGVLGDMETPPLRLATDDEEDAERWDGMS